MSWSGAPEPGVALCSQSVYEGAGGPLLTALVTVVVLKAHFGVSCCQQALSLCFSAERPKQIKPLCPLLPGRFVALLDWELLAAEGGCFALSCSGIFHPRGRYWQADTL